MSDADGQDWSPGWHGWESEVDAVDRQEQRDIQDDDNETHGVDFPLGDYLFGLIQGSFHSMPRREQVILSTQMTADMITHPEDLLRAIVSSKILEGIDNQPDHNGELHTSYWIPEPIKHEHDWRWNINKEGGTSDLFCVVDDCKDPFRTFKKSWGPKFPPKELWPRYEGPEPE